MRRPMVCFRRGFCGNPLVLVLLFLHLVRIIVFANDRRANFRRDTPSDGFAVVEWWPSYIKVDSGGAGPVPHGSLV